MTLAHAITLTQSLMGLAFLMQSLEHLRSPGLERLLFGLRIPLCVLLIMGSGGPWILLPVLALNTLALGRFRGPYNGGSDRMGTLMLLCLCGASLAPREAFQEVAMGYLALQVVLSYAMAGWVKLANRDWRRGLALRDLFAYSAYPVSESIRGLSKLPRFLLGMSWATLLFESLFPLALLSAPSTIAALVVASAFHLGNAALLGLNRFFWIWLAAYPSIIWLQGRVLS